ncbi:MAG TPA: 50S ribosomal protein L17 [Acidobacteria bacterium]|nr:50S ribosomal protein L17 [Acidobacteriota bacterium]
MRHRVAHRKLGRTSEHRLALLRNQAVALLRHERIETTVPKAKELRPFVERLITLAKRGLASEEQSKIVHARRLVRREIADPIVLSKLFDGIAPRFSARAGGYTRLLRLGVRRGDSAEVAQVELVGSEYVQASVKSADEKTTVQVKSKGVGGRLRAAAQRMRGKASKPTDDEASIPNTTDKKSRRASKKTKAAEKKSTDK